MCFELPLVKCAVSRRRSKIYICVYFKPVLALEIFKELVFILCKRGKLAKGNKTMEMKDKPTSLPVLLKAMK